MASSFASPLCVASGTSRSSYAIIVEALEGHPRMSLDTKLGRLLCWLGLHDFKPIDVTMSFGCGGSVETVKCQRCGYIKSRTGT